MDKVIILDGGKSITLPKSRDFSVDYVPVSHDYEMASGKKTRDIIGFRKVLTYSAEYFPATDWTKLIGMISTGRYLTVKHPDPETGDGQDIFDITPPNPSIFALRDGVGVWKDVSLTMESQEVYLNA